MTTPKHDKLEKIFSEALEKDSHDKLIEFLDNACGDDSGLRAKVTNLLSAHDKAGTFLETPPVDPDAMLEPETTGSRIGRYKILQKIGEGGFGTVYMAEQEEPVKRKVALKIIKLGMDTKQVIARFEAEQQALALMDHPNIATVFDAGATETGRPYFVMELVKGITIMEYCDGNKLSTRDRLELFLPVCHAVQHAHQKGIIHRDLKPNNVLVGLHENQPVPKVIDFGIAKATSKPLTEKTLFTEFRQFIGTPEYMSPDQAGVSGLDMDTRTDIYSLGVLLYELLTGTTPFVGSKLRAMSYEEIRRTIREEDPPKPSTRLLTLSAAPEEFDEAKLRSADPSALAKAVRGDLDWIAMKAMEKDRTRRYATAKDLAEDVERYLRHEPVLAGPPGVAYKFRKFVRRHRVSVVAGMLVGIALVIGLSLAVVGYIQANQARAEMEIERNAAQAARAREQEHRARAETSMAEALKLAARSATVSRFLQEVLRSVDPSKALGREVTVRYLLDEAVKRIDEGALAKQPEDEAAVRLTLGETYIALGLYDDAEEHVRTAEKMLSLLLGDEHPETLRADRVLAGLLRVEGKFAEAEALLRETARTQRRVLGEEHPDTLATMNELALALWGPGRFEEAETIHRQIVEIQRRVLGMEHADTLTSMGHLGAVCRALGNTDEVEYILCQAHEICRRHLGEDHPCTASTVFKLGQLREDQGDLEQAEELFRQTYELDHRIFGADHPRVGITRNNLIRILHGQGKTAAIHPLAAERIAHLKRAAERSDTTALELHAYAWELLNCEVNDLRDPEAALPAAVRAVELDGGRDPNTLETLAYAYRVTGNLDPAIETQRRAIAMAHTGGLYNLPEMEATLRDYLLESGKLVEAFNTAWDGLAMKNLGGWLLPGTDPDKSLVLRSEKLMAEDRFVEAAELLRACLSMRRKNLPEGHWLIWETKSLLGDAIAGSGQFVEAEPLLLEAYGAMKEDPKIAVDRKEQALSRIIRLYDSWGKPDKADQWRLELEEAEAGGATGE
ncbi:MAG: tetratricopeptide repeat protein [Planctomycetota bacterium]